MAIEDFLYEEVKECDAEFDFYIVYIQHECDDPYYPPYKDSCGIYKSKENAIKYARESFYKMAENCITVEDRKYGGVEGMFYIEGDYFQDSDGENKKCKVMGTERQVYIIYDKEEQKRVEARWEKMHGKMK